jgi:predicted alpha/beta-hydrolase family hydrolase
VITIDLDEGRRTTAVRYEPPDGHAVRAQVVLAHGAGGGQRHPFIVNVARRLAAAGVEVVTFNFPYMEQKRRVPDRTGVLEHCFRRVIETVHDDAARALVIGGKSMGGRIATHLAAQGTRIDAVFALGYPLHPPGKPDQPRVAHLPAITSPILIVQGEHDPFGTPSELRPVIATMKAPVRLEVVSGGDHSLAVRGEPADARYESLAATIVRWIPIPTRDTAGIVPGK